MPDRSHAARCGGFDDAPGCFASRDCWLTEPFSHTSGSRRCLLSRASPPPCSRPWPLPAAPEKLGYQTVSKWRLPSLDEWSVEGSDKIKGSPPPEGEDHT